MRNRGDQREAAVRETRATEAISGGRDVRETRATEVISGRRHARDQCDQLATPMAPNARLTPSEAAHIVPEQPELAAGETILPRRTATPGWNGRRPCAEPTRASVGIGFR